jgi:hypothetical protein
MGRQAGRLSHEAAPVLPQVLEDLEGHVRDLSG